MLSRFLFCLLLTSSPLLAADQPLWKAGTARTEITPTQPLWMAGYGSRTTRKNPRRAASRVALK